MKRFSLTAAGLAAAAICGAASADISVQIASGPMPGFTFYTISLGSITGTLTSFKADIIFTNINGDSSYASDLLLALSDGFTSAECGGFNSGFGTANDFGDWTSGASSTSGFYSMLANSHAGVAMNGSGTLYIANGWSGSTGASYAGKITLKGLDYVPAPGAVALLGLAGLRGRRRR